MIKKIFSHSSLYTVANHLPIFANIIILPIITPYLTKEDYGIYGLTFAYLGGLSAFSMLGIHVLLQNSFFKKNEFFKELWAKYFGILIVWRLLYSNIVLIIFYFLFKVKTGDDFLLYLILVFSPVIFFELTISIGTRYCQYEGKHQYVYITSFIAGFFAVLSSFISIYYFRLGYLGLLIGSTVSGFIQFLFFSYLIHFKLKLFPNFNISKQFINDTLSISLPIIPHSFSGYLLNTSDRLILDINNISLKNIGGYNISYNFSNYFESFNNSMNSVLSPLYFKLFALKDQTKSKKLVNSLTIFWFLFLWVLCVLVSLWCKEIMSFLYRNSEFSDLYKYVPFLLIGMMYRPFYVACVDKNIFLESTKSILFISGGGGIINLVLNLIFVPFYGIEAALYITFFSYLYMGFSGFYINSIKKNIDFSYPPILFIIIIFLTLFLAIIIRDIDLIIKAIITILFIISLIFIYNYKLSSFIKELNKEKLI